MGFEHISAFIRSYRQANGESLQSLADRSKVSRSMIAQIESGQKSPSITTLSKLAEAMSIRLGDLVDPPGIAQQIDLFCLSDANKVSKSNSPFICHQLMARAGLRTSDFYHFQFQEQGRTSFSANIAGSFKYLWLQQGKLTLHVGNRVTEVKPKQLVTFKASAPHRFESRGADLAVGVFLVTYQSN